MRIERFDPAADEASRRALYDVYADGAPVDDPACPAMSPAVFAGWLVHGWTAQPRETWLATDGNGPEGGTAEGGATEGGAAEGGVTEGGAAEGGATAGGYRLELPHRENQHQGILVIWVRPARRRAGLGTALLRHAAGRALAHGRSVLTAETRDGSAGDAFARSAGASPELTEIRRLLDVAAIPPGHLAGLRAAAQGAASGYSVLIWDGPTPPALVDQVAALNEAMADAPRGPDEQPQAWDAARVRGADQRVAAQGLRYYSAAARHDATGELAGLTQLGVDPAEPAWGHQELTAVARGHRGHRLGLLVKVAMLEHLAEREPQLQWVTTWNGESNRHMIAINETIGFRILDRWTTAWRLPVTSATPASLDAR